jgi:hypothetical protein
MTSSRALTHVLALAIAVGAVPISLCAQQAATGQATTPGARGTGGQGRGLRENRGRPQGFSVVLVLGDLRAVAGEEDVPPAARKALTDMKDFLPYRSYRLLDAAWILCCSSSRAITRLRGPDEHEYEVEIESGSVDLNRASVRFVLRDVSSKESTKPEAASSSKKSPQTIAFLQQQVVVARERLEAARANLSPQHPDIARLEANLQTATQRLKEAKEAEQADPKAREAERQVYVERRSAEEARERVAMSKFGDRSIMNTSFTMDLGETVVVGTSRLSGNSKALIALLTAVPPKSAR